ncbi:hypothetical protein LX16_0228 [Stackebrandtia albiflava]|uniref:DUF5753 domain-containing protein n=1 Tax=Stackebrandtia albiflava TaxID=406432 RepID=A0A562V9K5_9ACTN|nr:Scr1 family TA system antitoxin-like transcriptional regulator [Stackebrandtia albiflava]TWJ14543.1 hypothetical protein LX16_0228 [Stackebrandtia albiflava]
MTSNRGRSTTPAIELGLQLRTERLRPRPGKPRGYSKEEVPRHIASSRTILDIENGRKRTVKSGTVRDLCAFYRSDPDLIEHLALLAQATREDDWTNAYGSVVDRDSWLYHQLEDRAARLKFHDSTSIPSLIQPKSYVEMIRDTTVVNLELTETDWEKAIQYRLDRRARWLASKRPMTCLIGEAAIAMHLNNDAKRELRQTMLELARLPFADVRLIPFSAGRYDLLGWELNLLEFDNGEEPIIRTRTARGAGFIAADSPTGNVIRRAFAQAARMSIPVEEYYA